MARMRTKKTDENVLEAGGLPAPKEKKKGLSALPGGWKTADEALDHVSAVPTRFVDFNRGTRVGGLPLRRIHTVHGPTHGGKTAFVGGLIESFTSAGHIGAYVDAEHATPNEFFEELHGRPLREVPNFLAMRPSSYEQTIDEIDTLLPWIVEKKKSNPALASIIVVDSINKLVPKQELAKLRAEGGDALNKGWGRLRANMNQAWLDHLTPLLAAADCAFVIIAQERDDEVEDWNNPVDFKVKGGKSLLFDASLVIRVSKGKAVKESDKKDAAVYGFRHRVRIWKSKVSHMDGRHTDTFFHLSNGSLTPAGYDVARDLFEVANELGGIFEQAGAWYSFGRKRWQGGPNVIKSLSEDLDLAVAVRKAIDAKISPTKAA